MDNKVKRISQIENFFSMFLAKAKISDRYFINSIPKEIDKSWADLVYIELNAQTDKDAFTRGSASIYLYAKPIGAYYRKDVKKLDLMESILDEAISECHDPHYVLSVNWRDSSYDRDIDFFFNIVNVSIIAK